VTDDGQYTYRGLTFGRGSDLEVATVEGLEGAVMRTADQDLPRGDGAVPGPHYLAARTPLIEFVSWGGTPDVEPLSRLLATTFSKQAVSQPLEWKVDGYPSRLVYARPTQLVLPKDLTGRPKVSLACADPRIYAAALRTLSVPRYAASGGGLDYPGDYPKDFPAGLTVDAIATNAGGATAWPVLRFYGPTDGGTVTAVTLRNLTTGQVLTITTPITAGQILTVDNLARVTASGELVVALDGTSRYGSWNQPRTPFALPPGDSLLRFETAGTSTAVACVATWRDTWEA
jgi:hypothetical protein